MLGLWRGTSCYLSCFPQEKASNCALQGGNIVALRRRPLEDFICHLRIHLDGFFRESVVPPACIISPTPARLPLLCRLCAAGDWLEQGEEDVASGSVWSSGPNVFRHFLVFLHQKGGGAPNGVQVLISSLLLAFQPQKGDVSSCTCVGLGLAK